MNLPKFLINRAAPLQSSNGWIHIVPKGELTNTEAGIVQLLDDDSLDSILANIEAEKSRLGDKWPGLYAGREHFIYDSNQDSAALAWFKELEKRDDGIWANDDGLTPAGASAVKNHEYKFISFVAGPSDLEKVAGQSEVGLPVYRVLKIETVGFTNLANGKDLLTPISNRNNFGSHKTEAAWNAAKEENLRHVEANKADAAAAAAERTKASEGAATELALPALEKWFRAVKNIYDIGVKHGGAKMDYNWCWTKAKEEHPEIYKAAFGDADAALDEKSAAEQVSKLSNRIATASGKGFHFSWNFVRENLPRIFNRMRPPSERIRNTHVGNDTATARATAARICMSLAQAESAINKTTLSQGMQKITNRHPGLSGLARGKLLLSEAERMEPGVRTLIDD